MFRRARFQNGCLTREKRKSGPVWVFRWRDDDGVNRKIIVGSVAQYPTKALAKAASECYRVNIDSDSYYPRTVQQLIMHYKAKELAETGGKAYSTRHVYRAFLDS